MGSAWRNHVGFGLILAAVVTVAWWLRLGDAVPEITAPAPAQTTGESSAGADQTRTNRLISEKSPYLLQHAHNPVDWYPWGEEAFARARAENKPIFLSVGYSTCHWCHVMERESFEDPAIGRFLNEHFVSIKVDREERPDVDQVYMTFVQATTGGGGWPMSVWLTPDLKPFLGGTYFPPENRHGRPGFLTVLQRVAAAWKNDPRQILESSSEITRQLRRITEQETSGGPAEAQPLLQTAYEQLRASHDARHGGFGRAPKFPRPSTLAFLFRHHARTGAAPAREMALHTLRAMSRGGIHDHLGGGFHRYSVDERWHVPHFEKMLYDQAQLVWACLDAFQLTGDPFHAGVARDVLDYVLRDLTGPRGQFYSAEDADSPLSENPSDHAEGAFYVWEHREIEDVLGAETAAVFNYHYGVETGGNVAEDPHGEFPRKNVLFVAHSLDETARRFNRTPAATGALLADAQKSLLAARNRRPRPLLDDKVLTAWNGLMISAFARASQVLDAPEYLKAAERAAAFVAAELHDPGTHRLLRRHRDGESAGAGFLEDYAFLIQALLDLYEAGFDITHLMRAMALQQAQDTLFADKNGGGYFNTTGDDPSILLRMKDDYDGAQPSANSVAAMNLLRLASMTGRDDFQARADKTLGAFAGRLREYPAAMPQMLCAADFRAGSPKQIVIAGTAGGPDTRELLRQVHRHFLPNKVLLLADGAEGQKALSKHAEFLGTLKPDGGRATAFVCENFVCKLPTTDPAELNRLLLGSAGDAMK